MKSVDETGKAGHITEGDIFDDLGFSAEETLEAKIKSEILHAIIRHIEAHEYSQLQLASMLNVHQPDVSNLLKSKISKFSITRLIQFAGRLNLETRVQVSAPRSMKPISLKAQADKTLRRRSTPVTA